MSALPGGRGPGHGFTLIEVLISLLIMGVMAAVAAPAFLGERRTSDLADAEGRIEALFRMARDSAVRTATPVTVVIDSVSGLVWFDARTRLVDQQPYDPYADTSGATGPPGLRTEGAFGGGSTIGLRTAGAEGGHRGPAHGESIELPASVRMELFSVRGHFTFSPSGAAMGDSILIRASTGEVRLITVDPWNGRARIR